MAIPKKIHYCWFGKGEMSPLHHACMQTWKKYLAEYELVCWDEDNSPMDNAFISYHYKKKNWAFVSDYVRMYAIHTHGGIYLDVDIEILKNLDPLRDNECFLGEEVPGRITNGVCGGVANHFFFSEAIKFMEQRHAENKAVMISPEVCTAVYKQLAPEEKKRVVVYESEYFYPYNPYSLEPQKQILMASSIKSNTYAIHHWGNSWKLNPFARAFRKLNLLVRG